MRTRFGEFVLDTDRRLVERAGTAIHLTAKALALLEILIAERPRAIPKHELIDRVWPDVVVAAENVKNLISELRTALDDPGLPSVIRTAHGFGYAFVAEAAENDDSLAKDQRARPVEARNPYPGLAAFTEKDAGHFFGREAEVDAIWRKLERAPQLFALIKRGTTTSRRALLLVLLLPTGRTFKWSLSIRRARLP
jgi:DNA-binding winged helix-turn-helix (wHTH) protein